MRAPTARDALRTLMHPRQIEMPATAQTIAVWLRLRSAQVANLVPLTMLLSGGVRMLQLLVFAYF